MILTIRRWRGEDDDEYVPVAPYTGSIADLSPETPDEDDGLVDVSGRPIPRPEKPRRRMGFLPPEECE